MAKELWFICMFLSFVRGDTDNELYNNDGWIPITNMQAYNPERSDVILEQNMVQENPETQSFDDFIQIVTPDRKGRIFSPMEINPIIISETGRNSFEEVKQTSIAGDDYSSVCPDVKTENSKTQTNVPSNEMNRFDRSLKVPEETSIVQDKVIDRILNTYDYSYENAGDGKNKDSNKTLERKNYEVIEEAESTESGYVYETPKPNTSNKLNLTDKLFDVLAKYNIRADDNMQNYALSRMHKDRNPTALDSVRPFEFKTRGYNSLNHLPVDPLLAVFLSHYGHYLPSAYGIRSNYNNAYGYLASNNLHNNKPFGMYKMFSDSDSQKY